MKRSAIGCTLEPEKASACNIEEERTNGQLRDYKIPDQEEDSFFNSQFNLETHSRLIKRGRIH